MSKKFVLVLLICGMAFAQSAEEYCYSERVAGESCYMDCCQSLGYSWGDGGCMVQDSERDTVGSICSYCTDDYMQCVEDYQYGGGTSSGYPGGGGCCAGFIVPIILAAAAFYRSR
ncbi:MAG: hypothetical protein V1827_01950 [Candidatus Micrarchaeota archaeon]